MGFDSSSFMKHKFSARTEVVLVPTLSQFFDVGEAPEWVVRGQTGNELGAAIEATTTRKSLTSIVKAIGSDSAQIDELKRAIGLSDDVPNDIVKRLNQLTSCSVSPKIDHHCAVKLAETFPIEFYILTNKITELTGLGMEAAVKKPSPSGATQR